MAIKKEPASMDDGKPTAKKKRISQTDLPKVALADAVKVAKAIWENYAGDATQPHDVAIAMGISPTSSSWRELTGAAVAYGLTHGAYNADHIELTELAMRVVAPQEEGDDTIALAECAMTPKVPADFYRKYDRAKWPKSEIAANVLIGMGTPKERASDAAKLIEDNALLVGFIRQTKTGPFVSISNPMPQMALEDSDTAEVSQSVSTPDTGAELDDEKVLEDAGFARERTSQEVAQKVGEPNNRVFITHGKDTSTMEQIKQVVELGGFTPVVSVQRETAAKAVPDKVMDDMRICDAAIIHVSGETTITDAEGKTHTQLNPNVLIEIGAAMALYRDRFILVVEQGLELPSNLQGLYQSRYSGKELTFEAGMKILKALRGLKETS